MQNKDQPYNLVKKGHTGKKVVFRGFIKRKSYTGM